MKIIERKRLSSDLIESMMMNRGIDNIELFLNPTSESDTVLSDIPNIFEAVEMIKRNIGKTILILVDSDADGNSSAAAMYKYLKIVNPFAKLKYYIHPCKTHGITDEFIKSLSNDDLPDMIIVPDAGTNDIENREVIQKKGIDLLIIDHHNEDKFTSNGGILINNHAKYPENNINKNLTGSGMTYIVCKAFDEFAFHTNQVEKIRDLAMIGAIGDSASLVESETRNFCMQSINNIQSKAIRAVMKSNNQDDEDMTFTAMQFGGIVPLINAIVRVGTYEERELMFKALADIEPNYFEILEKRRKNKETGKFDKVKIKYSIYDLAVEAGKKCKDRQNKIVAKEMKFADEQFNKDAGIQIFFLQTDEAKGITGLLANKLSSYWQQPVFCVWEYNGDYTGSLRGWEKSLPSLKKWCENTGLFKLAQGHDNAAGVIFEKSKLNDIINATKKVEYEEVSVEVDKIYNTSVKIEDIFYVSSKIKMFKNGVIPPVFAVTNVPINENTTKWSKNTMRIYIDGVTYIKFKTPEEEYVDLINSHNCKIDIVGSFSINEWNGNKYPQFMIEDYDLCKTSCSSVDFGIFG